MRQAFVPEVGRVEYREVDSPSVGSNEVLIRVSRVGICGSDQHVFHGKHPLVRPPLVQGHEFSGFVEQVGKGVDKVTVGDLVTIQPAIGCGVCGNCKAGLPGQCAQLKFIGGNIPGAMCTLIAVHHDHVFKLPAHVSVNDSAMAEPLAVAVRAIGMLDNLEGKPVFVAGGGTIGQLVARVALLRGASAVILSDPNPHRRAAAEVAGCATIDPMVETNMRTRVEDLAGGREISAAVECVGTSSALQSCLEVLTRRAKLIVCGVFAKPAVIDMVKIQDQEITLQGSLMYSWDDFAEAVALLAGEKVELKAIQTNHVDFGAIMDGYALLDEPGTKAIKVFVDVE